MKSLTRQVRYLRRVAYDGSPGLPRLQVMIALASIALSTPDQPRFLKQAARRLDLELVAQILPDGGHISRNPGAILEALVDLLPLRQAFTARGTPALAHPRLGDRPDDADAPLLPRRRRHASPISTAWAIRPTDQLATILAYDDVRGARPTNAPHSGYQRVDAAGTTVIVDAGRPPPPEYSVGAHAGCLSFEMSVGRQRLIVNCGVPRPNALALRRLARTTVAHSTVTLNDTSSCRLSRSTFGEATGEAIVIGPTRIEIERRSAAGATVLALGHNGYVDRYRIVHERRTVALRMPATASRESTRSSIRRGAPPTRAARTRFAIRFHLHPNVRASVAREGHAVLLELPDGESWEFETDGLGGPDRGEHSPLRQARQPRHRAGRDLRARPADAERHLASAAHRPRRPPPTHHRRGRGRTGGPNLEGNDSGDGHQTGNDAAPRPRADPPRAALGLRQDRPRRLRPRARRRGVEIVSTGGTARRSPTPASPVTRVADVTGFPEILDGRVKTLHPAIHGGILAVRDDAGHARRWPTHGIAADRPRGRQPLPVRGDGRGRRRSRDRRSRTSTSAARR